MFSVCSASSNVVLYLHTSEIIFAKRAALYSEDSIAVNHLEITQ